MASDHETPALEQLIPTNLWGGPGMLAVVVPDIYCTFPYIARYMYKRGIFDPPGKPLNVDGFNFFFGWGVFGTNGTLWQGETLTFKKKDF